MKSIVILIMAVIATLWASAQDQQGKVVRERIQINEDWRFYRYDSTVTPDPLMYDVRPEVKDVRDDKAADAQPTEAVRVEKSLAVLKAWILPTGNEFIKDAARHHVRPDGNPGSDFPFVQCDFDDAPWQRVDLPHDWAIQGPFYEGDKPKVGGGMGRLPSHGVAWYRKKVAIPSSDKEKRIFLDVDGAMSYAMVWVNGHLAGGWPYGYASWRVDLTPYLKPGEDNQLAIRLDNPPSSSRWYPGGGLYRNVWLTKTYPIHVANLGTSVKTREISHNAATVDINVTLDNGSSSIADIEAFSQIFVMGADCETTGKAVASLRFPKASIASGSRVTVEGSVILKNPLLWGPPPTQAPNQYVVVTTLRHQGKVVDRYTTPFGIRSLTFDPEKGLFVNNERIFIKGVNQHHDLGALGAAFNTRAAERQLEMLREMGCNAIRMAHNPPAPELLDLTDRMGFLVVDEIFDVWERKKTPLDFHLIFPDWYEQDIRAFVRRDRNHPSVIMWSFGNEVGEQYTGEDGAALARKLKAIVTEEDDSRPATISMNYAKPDMPLPAVIDLISLNYQGEGIRDAPEYAGLEGIRTPPLFPAFKKKFPGKVIVSSENAAAVSTRGEYLFPVIDAVSAPVREGSGGDREKQVVSAYELYTVPFGASADKVFGSEDNHPYVAGGFVWSGWDYLGEPTPYYQSRSSYFGVIDLAGFKKDRFYLYQSRWRPELPMIHILPHWNWSEREREITPVHVFTSGDEAELFLNGKSLGRKKKQPGEYRLRWNDVQYTPGALKAIAYKAGNKWAEAVVQTTGPAKGLSASADRQKIRNDGYDLSFITVRTVDENGLTVPRASNDIAFHIEGPGEIVATDNGDPTSFVPFTAHNRAAFNGLCLVIVRAIKGGAGQIKIVATSDGLETTAVNLEVSREK